MHILEGVTRGQQNTILGLSTVAFGVCFAVWTIFSIIGLQIKEDLGLNDTEFGILVATPVLTGSVSRIFLGIWTDQYGGRIVYTLVMLTTAVATWLLSTVETYPMFLLAALGVGLAGGSFAVGIAYVSRWYEAERQGTALGIFGTGNVGAAVTNFGAPFLLIAFGWIKTAQIYAIGIALMAVVFYLLTKEDPAHRQRKTSGAKPISLKTQLEPLKKLQVWRFGTYYFFVFGGFVALASWLPRYYVGAYELDLALAGMLAAAYSTPTSLFRALGGWLSDRWGARTVMYLTFIVAAGALFVLSYPETRYVISGIEGPIEFSFGTPLPVFVGLTILLGIFMSFGSAAVYKHIPVYYPHHVGAVGGLVGMIGGLGGFFMPIFFGLMNDLTGVWTSCFMLMFAVVATNLIWMHVAIRRMERRKFPAITAERDLSDLPERPVTIAGAGGPGSGMGAAGGTAS